MNAVPPTERVTTYTSDGLSFEVVDAGPLDGTPVVLLHGFPQTATCWAKVSPLLHEAGYRTFTPTMRGYSPLARPRQRRAFASRHLVADVRSLLGITGRAHLVGHDWGANVGWNVAGAHPAHLSSFTAVSVCHPRAFLASLFRSSQWRKSWYMGFFQLPVLPERALSNPKQARKAFVGGGMTTDEVERYLTEVVDTGALRGGLSYYRGIPFSPSGQMPRHIEVPTMLVWSDNDVALVRKGPELTQDWVTADYRFRELSGVSHWIPDQAPEALAALIIERADSAASEEGA